MPGHLPVVRAGPRAGPAADPGTPAARCPGPPLPWNSFARCGTRPGKRACPADPRRGCRHRQPPCSALSGSRPGRWRARGAPRRRPGSARCAPPCRSRDVAYLRSGTRLYALALAGPTTRLVSLGRAARAERAVLALRAGLDAQVGRVLTTRLAAAVGEATRRDSAAPGRRCPAPAAAPDRRPRACRGPHRTVGHGALVDAARLLRAAGDRSPSASTWLTAQARIGGQPPGPPASRCSRRDPATGAASPR